MQNIALLEHTAQFMLGQFIFLAATALEVQMLVCVSVCVSITLATTILDY